MEKLSWRDLVVRISLFTSHRFILLVLVFASTLRPISGQSAIPLLERTITITFEQEGLQVALQKISQQGNFTFSYNPAIVDASRMVRASFAGMTVREVLDELFQGSVQYKVRGNYIILTKARVAPESESRVYSGYVVDEATGKRLNNVSVYDPISFSSAVTDAYGYFQIKIDKPSADVILAINKENYTDTIIAVPSGKRGLLKIPINVSEEKLVVLADSVGKKIVRFWKNNVLDPKSPNIDNINDTLYRTTQVSLVPFVGTNHALSGNVINDYSFNIFGGYSRGVKKLEIGGLFNIVREDVTGMQYAGLFNAVGGKMKGIQLAGLANLNQDSVKGAQFAGLINFNWNSIEDFSAAGLVNFTHQNSKGFHMTGLGNMTLGEEEGGHLAGLFNFATKNASGIQAAGMLNFTGGDMRGAQLSGLMNFAAHKVRGGQVAGLINIAPGKINGAQVSGVLNYATNVKGLQLGLINISDSIRGVPIGFLSFALKGYHQLEVSADEVFYTNLAFRTGVRQFYNIFTVGAKPDTFENEETYWTFGYGVGTAPRLSRKLYLNFDITSNQVVLGDKVDAINMINKAYLGLEVQPVKKIAFTAGITLNAHVTDTENTQYPELFTDYTPHIIHDETYSNNLNVRMWLGAKLGVRFF